jgi:hypothetical protein
VKSKAAETSCSAAAGLLVGFNFLAQLAQIGAVDASMFEPSITLGAVTYTASGGFNPEGVMVVCSEQPEDLQGVSDTDGYFVSLHQSALRRGRLRISSKITAAKKQPTTNPAGRLLLKTYMVVKHDTPMPIPRSTQSTQVIYVPFLSRKVIMLYRLVTSMSKICYN